MVEDNIVNQLLLEQTLGLPLALSLCGLGFAAYLLAVGRVSA